VQWLWRRLIGRDCRVVERRSPKRPTWLEIAAWLATVLAWSIARTGIPGTQAEHAVVLFLSVGTVFY